MPSLKLIALLLAVTVVAACGPDPRPGGNGTAGDAPAGEGVPAGDGGGEDAGGGGGEDAGASDPGLDDEELVRLVFVAAADGDPTVLPERLPPRVSAMRVGVVAFHDQLLERRQPVPGRDAVLDALEALAGREGGVDTAALAALVPVWRGWTDEQVATEIELARLLSLANAALTLPSLPGAGGLRDVADKAAEHGPPPPSSAAAAGLEFVRFASLAVGEEGSGISEAQSAALESARDRFEALGWPGGLAMMAEPLAERLLALDPVSMRGTVLWTTAANAYRTSGDLLRAGTIYTQRARVTWHGQADVEAARRAAQMAENGRRSIEQSGAGGRELFEACFVHAFALQACGRHEEAVEAADAALAAPRTGSPEELADIERARAVSLYRMGRFEDCADGALRGLEGLGPDFDPEIEEARILVPALQELAAQALLEVGRYDEAAALLESVAAFHEREDGQPWASEEQRDNARLLGARALARKGDGAAARAAVRAVLDSGAKGSQTLAFAADVLLEAGHVDDAADIVAQLEHAAGPERRALFGELRGRIEAGRGDLEAAREAFRGAVDYITGGDPTMKSWSASRVWESWARAEEAAGNPDRARELFQTAANHLVDMGMDRELRRLLDEAKRLQD